MAVPKARTVIRERYQLESMIGEGGMASVWRARDLTLARAVAVKLLFARDERDKNALAARFLREARIAASVQHRNVIQIVDFGTTDDELPFMVMELLEGEPLSGRMHRERRLPLQDVVQIANLTLRGLAAVHAAGIIHRDLKPDNIYLKRESESIYPTILDFGISRSVEPQSGRRSALTTREGLIIGTPEYMSPEQARGVKNIDVRTDLYSMGVILYEALTGRLPFHSENVGDLIIQVVTGTAPTVHELLPSIPLEISKVIERAMARKREDRFSSAGEMQAALLAAAARTELRNAPSLYSDLPAIAEGGSGTRRLSTDAISPSDAEELTSIMQPTPRIPAIAAAAFQSDASAIVPPVTQTVSTLVLGNPYLHRLRRYAIPLAAAAAVVYSTLALWHARSREPVAPASTGASLATAAPSASQSSATHSSATQPSAALPPKQGERAVSAPAGGSRPDRIHPEVVQGVVGEQVLKPRVPENRRRARAKPSASKTHKPQGALRNLDF